MKILKTIGYLVGYLVIYYVATFVSSFAVKIITNAVNLDTFVGQIITVVVMQGIIWFIIFWGNLFLANYLIVGKISGVICLVLVVLWCSRDLENLINWVLIVCFIVLLSASVLPIVFAMFKDNEKSVEKSL